MAYKYNSRDIFHKINNGTKAYVFGLLWADGNFSVDKTCIGLTNTDKKLLISIQKKLGGSLYSRSRYDKRTGKIYVGHELRFFGKQLYKDLISKGFRSEAKIPKKFLKHFLLGFFDGDGCIHISKNGTVQVIFSGKYNDNWEWFYKTVKYFGVFNFVERHIVWSKSSKGSNVRINGKIALELLKFLYDSKNDIFMKRKYKKFSLASKLYLTKEFKGGTRVMQNRKVFI